AGLVRCLPVLCEPGRLVADRPDGSVLEPVVLGVADAGVRGLLVLHAVGRGGSGHRVRAGAGTVRHGRTGTDRHRGRREVHLPVRAGRAVRRQCGGHQRSSAPGDPGPARPALTVSTGPPGTSPRADTLVACASCTPPTGSWA